MKKTSLIKRLYEQRELQLMVIPGVIFFIVFAYTPMYGLIISFQNYQIGNSFLGFGSKTEWIGLTHFITFINDPSFFLILRNTLVISLLRMLITFPAPIVFAIILNEIRSNKFKKTVQSASYLPHFVSWVIVGGLVSQILSVNGTLNGLLMGLNIIKEPIMFLGEKSYFWYILIGSDLWKEMGWNAIIFLAAMAAIDPELYQVANIDGANRWQRIKHITLPGINSTLIIVLLFTIGSLLMYGFEPIMQLTNNLNNKQLLETAEVIDTHVLRMGVMLGNYSYATAIGLFRSIASVLLLAVSNAICKKSTGTGLW